jgi:hypothetical protein
MSLWSTGRQVRSQRSRTRVEGHVRADIVPDRRRATDPSEAGRIDRPAAQPRTTRESNEPCAAPDEELQLLPLKIAPLW